MAKNAKFGTEIDGKKTGNARINSSLRRVHVTIVIVEKQ